MFFFLFLIFWLFGVITLKQVFGYWFLLAAVCTICDLATCALIYFMFIHPLVSIFGV